MHKKDTFNHSSIPTIFHHDPTVKKRRTRAHIIGQDPHDKEILPRFQSAEYITTALKTVITRDKTQWQRLRSHNNNVIPKRSVLNVLRGNPGYILVDDEKFQQMKAANNHPGEAGKARIYYNYKNTHNVLRNRSIRTAVGVAALIGIGLTHPEFITDRLPDSTPATATTSNEIQSSMPLAPEPDAMISITTSAEQSHDFITSYRHDLSAADTLDADI